MHKETSIADCGRIEKTVRPATNLIAIRGDYLFQRLTLFIPMINLCCCAKEFFPPESKLTVTRSKSDSYQML